tara:strand:+ start:1867 stop:1971 length:105 start_codon:yes stop_codon:yes gene_type:complete
MDPEIDDYTAFDGRWDPGPILPKDKESIVGTNVI